MSTTPADAYELPPASRLAAVLQALMTEYPTDDAEFSPDAVAAVLTVMPLHGDDQGIAVEVPLQAGQVEWLTNLVRKESAHCRNSHPDQSGQCGHCAGTGSARPTTVVDPAAPDHNRSLRWTPPAEDLDLGYDENDLGRR
ncbi:hypothetical protein [Streptomyces chartreusis]|uniref:Uncharacterized protein n=1 Tax=Streptomyces chartreusis TaxID=1969 RepID=A0A7H8TAS1_STRCX|nr:hypothetical protein [Streptomyces chartreusis]QKZ20593.1 hypothetical protein HUT05_26570 [Streptomyces chartreusis]